MNVQPEVVDHALLSSSIGGSSDCSRDLLRRVVFEDFFEAVFNDFWSSFVFFGSIVLRLGCPYESRAKRSSSSASPSPPAPSNDAGVAAKARRVCFFFWDLRGIRCEVEENRERI